MDLLSVQKKQQTIGVRDINWEVKKVQALLWTEDRFQWEFSDTVRNVKVYKDIANKFQVDKKHISH